jgi:two-component system chemotaxis response regulator CheY
MTRILLVDDARIMREIAREIVEPESFEVAGEAADGIRAVRQFESLRPDVVLLDLVMPKLGGIAALRAIRELDPTARVVMSCSLGQEPLAAEAMWWGALDSVVKPFRPDAVVRALRGAVAMGAAPAG